MRPLIWLRWRQFWSGTSFWLLAFGVDTRLRTIGSRLYLVYALFILIPYLAWALLGGIAAAAGAGQSIAPADRAGFVSWLPWIVVGIQAILLLGALRSTPLQFPTTDAALVASTPVPRWGPPLLAMVREAVLGWLVIAPVVVIGGVILQATPDLARIEDFATASLAVALPVWLLTLGASWALGLLRMTSPRLASLPLLWLLLPAGLLGAAYLLPEVFQLPGTALVAAFETGTADSTIWWLAASVALIAAIGVSTRINFIDVIAESDSSGRSLLVSAIVMRDARVLVQRPTRPRRDTVRRLRLPDRAGVPGLLSRSALTLVRRPRTVLWLVGDTVIVVLAAWLASVGTPIQLWTAYLIGAVVFAPAGITQRYRADAGDPFLRSLLPFDPGPLFIASSLINAAIVALAGLLAWLVLVLTVGAPIVGFAVVLVMTAAVGVCQALDVTRLGPTRTRVPYRVALGLLLTAFVLLSIPFGLPVVAIAFAVFITSVLVRLISGSEEPLADSVKPQPAGA